MRVTQIIADLHVTDLEAARAFYNDYLGLTEERFNLGWVARYASPDTGINLQVMTRDATALLLIGRAIHLMARKPRQGRYLASACNKSRGAHSQNCEAMIPHVSGHRLRVFITTLRPGGQRDQHARITAALA